MWWLTSTTGASAHWPKQATVRMVNLRSGVVSASLSASLDSLTSGSLRPRSRQTLASRSREPRVWQAVPRQTQMTLSPCGSRLGGGWKVGGVLVLGGGGVVLLGVLGGG